MPRIDKPAVGMARSEADTVVTQHGVAQVKHIGLAERAEALIGTAAPELRASLADEWARARAGFG